MSNKADLDICATCSTVTSTRPKFDNIVALGRFVDILFMRLAFISCKDSMLIIIQQKINLTKVDKCTTGKYLVTKQVWQTLDYNDVPNGTDVVDYY